jgi:hypothetical protein
MFKKIEIWIVYLVSVVFLVVLILYGAVLRSNYVKGDLLKFAQPAAVFLAEIPSNLVALFEISNRNEIYVRPEEVYVAANPKAQIISNDSFNLEVFNDHKKGFILTAAQNIQLNQPSIFLFDLKKNKIVYEWNVKIQDIENFLNINSPDQPWRMQHPLLLENGEIVFTHGEGPLVKIGACSDIIWAKDGVYHHSINFNDTNKNEIIVPSIYSDSSYLNNYYDVTSNIRDDSFEIINIDSGETLSEVSILKTLLESGLEDIVTLVIAHSYDPIHLNDAEPILQSDDYFNSGDIIFSSRHLNAIGAIRPKTSELLFLKQGLFSMQHDIDYQGEGVFTFYGNNNRINQEALQEFSRIYSYDFKNDKLISLYNLGYIDNNSSIQNPTQGLHKIISEQATFIDTSTQAIIFNNYLETTFNLSVQLPNNRYSALSWSRYYDNLDFLNEDFFNIDCQK